MTKKGERKCLFVLGMHRSGTSVVTRALSLAGAHLPADIMPAGKDNPSGYWEPEKIAHLHDKLMAEAGSSWHDWRAFDLCALERGRIKFYQKEIKQLIKSEYGDQELFVLKEPRISRFVPFYLEIFKSMSIAPLAVFPVRNPDAVIRSIQVRDGFDPAVSKLIWLRNVLETERSTRNIPRIFFTFENFLHNWKTQIKQIGTQFSIQWPVSEIDYEWEIGRFIKPKPTGSTSDKLAEEIKPEFEYWVEIIYENLKRLCVNGDDQKAISEFDRIYEQFNIASQQFGGIQPKMVRDNATLIGMNFDNRDLRNKLDEFKILKSKFLLSPDEASRKVEKLTRELEVSKGSASLLERAVGRLEAELNAQKMKYSIDKGLQTPEKVSEKKLLTFGWTKKFWQYTKQMVRKIPILRSWNNSLMTLYQRGMSYWRRNGTGMLMRRLSEEMGLKLPKLKLHERLQKLSSPAVDAQGLVAKQYPNLLSIGAYKVTDGSARLTMVTDSISSGSLFGGVGTALILATQIAENAKADLRVVTRTEAPAGNNVAEVLERNGVSFSGNIDFQYCPLDRSSQLEVHGNDIFLTTSWWTTNALLKSVKADKIWYLIQEDERMFYPYGDEHHLCWELMRNNEIRYVVNSQLLFDHFKSCNDNAIVERGIWFEPAFSKCSYFKAEKRSRKKQFFFYARPYNHRNLFFLGLEAIDQAVRMNVLDPQEWDFNFVGKDVPSVNLGDGVAVKRFENLRWSEYANLIRDVDLALSLMYTPHPSYPPLDVAASGGVVVTNQFANKQDLSGYSKNIICAQTRLTSLVDGLEKGVELAMDQAQREQNFENNTIVDNWQNSLNDVICEVKKAWNNVSD